MERFFVIAALLLSLSLAGCGNKELGPADPSATPQVDQQVIEDAKKQSMEHMPPEAKKMYGGSGK